jgi:hypothetical protein
MLKHIRSLTLGILRDSPVRRVAMTATVLAAAAMLFAGATFLASWLAERPYIFLLFWFACAWLTLTSLLLALYDILVLRKLGREERRDLARRIFRDEDHTE